MFSPESLEQSLAPCECSTFPGAITRSSLLFLQGGSREDLWPVPTTSKALKWSTYKSIAI